MPDNGTSDKPSSDKPASDIADANNEQPDNAQAATEYGGPKGKEPTRYGDWEKKGRCIDF